MFNNRFVLNSQSNQHMVDNIRSTTFTNNSNNNNNNKESISGIKINNFLIFVISVAFIFVFGFASSQSRYEYLESYGLTQNMCREPLSFVVFLSHKREMFSAYDARKQTKPFRRIMSGLVLNGHHEEMIFMWTTLLSHLPKNLLLFAIFGRFRTRSKYRMAD